MTTWINKEKFKEHRFKEENFSIKETDGRMIRERQVPLKETDERIIREQQVPLKEGFDNISLQKNPLEQFLKANPLKSIFDSEPIDSRNLKEGLVPTKVEQPATDEDDLDNLNPFGAPPDEMISDNKPKNKKIPKGLTPADRKHDNALINSITISLVSLFITLYVSYNWYFNFTEGFSKRFQFYEKFDVVNYMYFFTEYFYKIVKLFDETTSITIPGFVNKIKNSRRLVFILIFMISYFIVKTIVSLFMRIYKYFMSFIKMGKKRVDITSLMKNFYNPKGGNIYITLVFVFFVIEGIISSFKSGYVDKKMGDAMGDAMNTATDPSSSFKDSMTSFKIAHPLVYLIVVLIRISIIYLPTISAVYGLFFLYFNFYSFFGIAYYLKIDKDAIDEANIYNGVRDGSFIDMFRRIHAAMNANEVLFDIKDEPGISNKLEQGLRILFNNLPFILMFIGLFRTIPSILKIYSPMYKWAGIGLISSFGVAIIKFMMEENPKIYILQQEIINNVGNSFSSLSKIFEKKEDDVSANVPSNAP